MHYVLDFFRFIFDFFYSLNKSVVFTKDENFVKASELQGMLERGGCKVITGQLMYLSREEVIEHYPHIKDKSFFPETQKQYEDYPVYVFLVRGRLKKILKIIGECTDPSLCNPNSFRKKYGKNKSHNVAHRTGLFKERFAEYRRFFGKYGFVTLYRKNTERWLSDQKKIAELLPKVQ